MSIHEEITSTVSPLVANIRKRTEALRNRMANRINKLKKESDGNLDVSYETPFASLPGAKDQVMHPDDKNEIVKTAKYQKHPAMSMMVGGISGAALHMWHGGAQALELLQEIDDQTPYGTNQRDKYIVKLFRTALHEHGFIANGVDALIQQSVITILPGEFCLFETRNLHGGVANHAGEGVKKFDTYSLMLTSILSLLDVDGDYTEGEDGEKIFTEGAIRQQIAAIKGLNTRVHFALHHNDWVSKDQDENAYADDRIAVLCEGYVPVQTEEKEKETQSEKKKKTKKKK
jgi:hypothetical protein